jgi:hypothetical protein
MFSHTARALKQSTDLQAKILYDAIEASGGFYNSPVDPAVRSRMNVPFTIPSNSDLDPEFIKGAAAQGLVRFFICLSICTHSKTRPTCSVVACWSVYCVLMRCQILCRQDMFFHALLECHRL